MKFEMVYFVSEDLPNSNFRTKYVLKREMEEAECFEHAIQLSKLGKKRVYEHYKRKFGIPFLGIKCEISVPIREPK